MLLMQGKQPNNLKWQFGNAGIKVWWLLASTSTQFWIPHSFLFWYLL